MNEQLHYSDQGKAFTKGEEQLRFHAYPDVAGVWTNGYGHTGRDVWEGQAITLATANAWFDADVLEKENAVKRLVTVPLTQGQFDACVDFVFNEGEGHFANSTLLRLLNNGHYDLAAAQFPEWIYAGGKPLEDLKRRRAAEVAMFTGKQIAVNP